MTGKASFGAQNMLASFCSDHFLKIAQALRLGGWRELRTKEGMGCADVCYPVAHRLVDCIFQRAAAGIDAGDFRAEQSHAKNIKALALHVLGAHINSAG